MKVPPHARLHVSWLPAYRYQFSFVSPRIPGHDSLADVEVEPTANAATLSLKT